MPGALFGDLMDAHVVRCPIVLPLRAVSGAFTARRGGGMHTSHSLNDVRVFLCRLCASIRFESLGGGFHPLPRMRSCCAVCWVSRVWCGGLGLPLSSCARPLRRPPLPLFILSWPVCPGLAARQLMRLDVFVGRATAAVFGLVPRSAGLGWGFRGALVPFLLFALM